MPSRNIRNEIFLNELAEQEIVHQLCLCRRIEHKKHHNDGNCHCASEKGERKLQFFHKPLSGPRLSDALNFSTTKA